MFKKFALATAIGMATIISTPATSQACLWDNDTLAQERQRFPSVLELMTGKFLRHSPEYYQWRVTDRTAKLANLEDQAGQDALALMDDIGVALSKLDRHEEAIAMGRKALAIDENRYKTHANLGTFLIHDGKLAEGVKHIWKAIEINPQAHFGRERWQAYIVEYVIKRKAAAANAEGAAVGSPLGNAEYGYGMKSDLLTYLRSCVKEREQRDFDPAEALKGMLGIMRFGKHDHPIVLETVAQLLMAGNEPHRMDLDKDGRLLAARCLLLAAQNTTSESAGEFYKKGAAALLGVHEHVTLAAVQDALNVELKEGQVWYAELRADELGWIAAGNDVDAQYAAKYYEDPTSSGPVGGAAGADDPRHGSPAEGEGRWNDDRHREQESKLAEALSELERLKQELSKMREELTEKHPEMNDPMSPSDSRNKRDSNGVAEPERQGDDRDRKTPKQSDGRQQQSADREDAGHAVGMGSAGAPGSIDTESLADSSRIALADDAAPPAAPVSAEKPQPRSNSGGCNAGNSSSSLTWPLSLLVIGMLALVRRRT